MNISRKVIIDNDNIDNLVSGSEGTTDNIDDMTSGTEDDVDGTKDKINKLPAWKKIFYMFYHTRKGYPNETAIAEATTELFKLDPPMRQSTVSKNMDILSGIIEYSHRKYTVRKNDT